MMRRTVNFFRGSVRLEVKGAFPERFLNLCAQNGVRFWGVEWVETGVVRLTVARGDRKLAEALGEKVLCEVAEEGGAGLPAFLERFRRRYALLVGLGLSLLAVCILSQFILTVEVSGNEAVSSERIMGELRRLGVRAGAYGPGIDPASAAQELLQELPELSWCAVNLRGTVAEVLVRERIPRPELVDETVMGDVVATAPGLITHMDVLQGERTVQEGDTVAPGDVLITGNIHIQGPEYGEVDLGWRQVRAQGSIYARTWRVLEAEIDLTAAVKTYTGEEKSRWALEIMGRHINFYANSGISFTRYDKIKRTWQASLPGDRRLPLCLSRETVREYETQSWGLDAQAAEEMLKARLAEELKEQLGSGETVTLNYTAARSEGKLTVRLEAECREEIGKFVPYDTQPQPAQP